MEDMDSWVVVHASRHRRYCRDLALVLDAVDIPNMIADGEHDAALLLVPSGQVDRARRELHLYEAENPAQVPAAPPPLHGFGVPGVFSYAVVLLVCFAGQQQYWFGADWVAAGALDGVAIRNGEWWRVFTALTLHGDAGHLAANLVFGAFFGAVAGQYLGSGLAWAAIVLAAAAGNMLDILLLPPMHRALGASTAVFAALGLVGAFVWASGSHLAARWRPGWARRWAPVIGAVVLLAYIGTGDENTDVVAHLTGFAMGFAAGIALGLRLPAVLRTPRVQLALGAGVLIVLSTCWWLVLKGVAGTLV